MALMEIILLLVTILFLLYKVVTKDHGYFDNKNVPHLKPFLWFNNFSGAILGKESFFDCLTRFHMHFKNEKIYGMFDLTGPTFVIRDPNIIKQILVKDFDHFVNRKRILNEEDDQLFGNSVFSMHGEKWKDMRTTLTPAFTGSKMRVMFDLVQECCEETVRYLENELEKNSKTIDLDVKDFFTRFTNDVIATTAFGIKVNSLTLRENEFYKMGKTITDVNLWQGIKFILLNNFPSFTKAIGMKFFADKEINYFKNLVLDAMKYREEHNIIRPDMINILMEARKAVDKKRDWTEDEIIAQCFVFFMAGFETTGMALCFAAYELMLNENIQEKLINEIRNVQRELNGKPITYEILLGMKYLDMVMSETLRKWPNPPFLNRICNENYEINLDENNKIPLIVGDSCNINVFGLHRDPNNFSDPEKFDPERFNDDNKNNIIPYTYLPFGFGPRNCIGNRLALMETKAILYYLLSNFKFELSEKVILPTKLEEGGFRMIPKGGFWLKLSKANIDPVS